MKIRHFQLGEAPANQTKPTNCKHKYDPLLKEEFIIEKVIDLLITKISVCLSKLDFEVFFASIRKNNIGIMCCSICSAPILGSNCSALIPSSAALGSEEKGQGTGKTVKGVGVKMRSHLSLFFWFYICYRLSFQVSKVISNLLTHICLDFIDN